MTPGWTVPQPLNEDCCASHPVPVADPWNQLHVFWAEKDGFISYTRLNDQGWSVPVEIIASQEGNFISLLDATVDQSGYLHLVWVDSPVTGPLFYSRAWAFDADDAHAWQAPVMIAENVLGCSIKVDSTGLVHVVYNPFEAGKIGGHVTTQDGIHWSPPNDVGSNLETRWTASGVQLAIDQQDTLHITWNTTAFPEGFPPHAIYYQRSIDGGLSWSDPYDIDPLPPEVDADDKSAFKNTASSVAVGPSGDVHLTWHQYTGLRWHRWSSDGGRTWSQAERVFPDMGAAYNGLVDMAFDSNNRMHIIATRGTVWYQQWNKKTGWTTPELVDSAMASWHHQRIAVLEGNRVYLFYADVNVTGIIWYTSKVFDAPPVLPAPRPTVHPVSTALPTSTPTTFPVITPTATTGAVYSAPLPPENNTSNETIILISLLPASFVVVVVTVAKLAYFRRR